MQIILLATLNCSLAIKDNEMKINKSILTEATTAAQPIDQPTLESIQETIKLINKENAIRNYSHPFVQEINRLFRVDQIGFKDEFFR